jgi:hypothetical protein
MSEYHGLATWVVYLWALMDQVWGTLFILDDPTKGVSWTHEAGGQWVLQGMNLPALTPKGLDLVSATMTIVHNGMVFLAQLSTLLPANALTG